MSIDLANRIAGGLEGQKYLADNKYNLIIILSKIHANSMHESDCAQSRTNDILKIFNSVDLIHYPQNMCADYMCAQNMRAQDNCWSCQSWLKPGCALPKVAVKN